MAGKVLDYRPAQNEAVAPSIVHVERSAGGGVLVRVDYPAEKFRGSVIVTCCVLGLFLIPFLWFSGWSVPGLGHLAVLPGALFVAGVASLLIRTASRLGQSCALEADGDGITVHHYRGRREWSERLPREAIIDVRLGFGGGGRSGRSTAWLIIALRAPYQFNRRLLHDLGGNHLARVADAIREGLGLEPVDWPSGQPRKARAASPVERPSGHPRKAHPARSAEPPRRR